MDTDTYPYRIGTASADITPPAGVTLVGYTPRTSTGLGHPLVAEALYCEGEEAAWILISADIIGLRRRDTQTIRRAVAGRTGVAEHCISVAGTHTHSGPATILSQSEDLEQPDRGYLPKLWDTLADLAARAKSVAQPARFECGRAAAPELGSNRRVQLPDGTWTNEWRDPDGAHTGFFDPSVYVVSVRRSDESLASVLVNYGCHPVTLGPESLAISPDYPGYLKERLAAETGAETASFLLAGGANINPRVSIQVGEAYPRKLASALAAHVHAALAASEPLGAGPVGSATREWVFLRTRDSYKRAGMKGNRRGDEVRTEVTVHRAGDFALVAVPGELFSEYNQEIRTASPCGCTMIVTLANDYIGYIPTNAAQEEGAYETKMAPATGIGESLMEHVREAFDVLEGSA